MRPPAAQLGRGCGAAGVGGQGMVGPVVRPQQVGASPWLTKGRPCLRWSRRGSEAAAPGEARLLTCSLPFCSHLQLLCLQAQPHSHDPQPVGGAALPQRQPQPAGSSGRTGPARCRSLHSVQRPSVEAGKAHNTYTLTSFGARQEQAEAKTRPFPPGRAARTGPLLADCPLSLALSDPARTPSLHGLSGQAGTATCSTLPGPRVPGWMVAWSSGWAHPIGVYVCACDVTSPPALARGPHTHRQARTPWARDVAPELLPRLDLMQTFRACWVGAHLRSSAQAFGTEAG